METNQILIEVFGRVSEHVHNAVDGLDAEQLAMAPAPGSNPIGWLVWHLHARRGRPHRRAARGRSAVVHR